MTDIIIAYGNTDRQDDGIAWHVLRELAQRLGGQLPPSPQEGAECSLPQASLIYMLQLTPEVAADFAGCERVVFIDAHTGAVAEDIHLSELDAAYQSSPLTHHLTPESCLAIAAALNGQAPRALLVSVRGYQFGFSSSLSPEAARLVPLAADQIMEWLK
jgi:hydrogenase maturation protease